MCQVGTFLEESMEAGMSNFKREGYRGVTETWNVLQHEVTNFQLTARSQNVLKLSQGEYNINSCV